MRNAPSLNLEGHERDANHAPVGIEIPTVRLVVLMVFLTLPIAMIGARLVRVQGQLTARFMAPWQSTTLTEEYVPCPDGRILSADGQVLAHDRLRYDILVHYRWLEDPPDERWLVQQALSRLPRSERRDQVRVEDSKQQVLRERRRLWDLLATSLNRPQSELVHARNQIQRRVESIVESVTRRRDARVAEARLASLRKQPLISVDVSPLTPAWWAGVRELVVGELTTSPHRERLDPVIVEEELDYHAVAVDVNLETVTAIETTPSLFPGVIVRSNRERVYPLADSASHIIGVRSQIKPDESPTADNEADTDGLAVSGSGGRIGRNGIERAFDADLRGRQGIRQLIRNRGGDVLSQSVVQDPVPGEDIVLTIDLGLQRTAESLLDDALTPPPPDRERNGPGNAVDTPQGGCLVVLDVRTGDVLVAAAAPRHDLGLLTRPDPEDWKAALSDPRRPFFPRVTQMTVPPGSVFKILTAVALLESEQIDPDEPFYCQGYLDQPDRNRCYIFRHYGVGHGDVTLTDAICQSCNVYFFHAAKTVGPAAIVNWAERFGLGVATGAEVPGEKGGHLPQIDRAGRITGEHWYSGSTLQLAIGQASLTVTPLQVARMVAAIANGGYLVTPRFVSARPSEPMTVPNSSLRLTRLQDNSTFTAVERIPGLSDDTLERIREAMVQVVQSPRGTGRHAAVDGITIAGKTGTAEVGGGKPDHAWFVGFVPAESPRYAFAIVLEHGGSGGSTSAPIAKALIEAMADAGVLRRDTPVAAVAE